MLNGTELGRLYTQMENTSLVSKKSNSLISLGNFENDTQNGYGFIKWPDGR